MFRSTFFELLVISLPLFAAEPDKAKRTIDVQGNATIEVAPNIAVISLTVKTIRKEAEQASTDHHIELQKVLGTIKVADVGKDATSSSNMIFGEHTVYRDRENVKDGYYASTTVQVKITDLTKYVPLWKSLTKFGDVSITETRLDHTDRIKYQEAARTEALKAAKEKAKTMAAVLDLSVGMPYQIADLGSQTDDYDNRRMGMNSYTASSSESSTGTAGKIAIRARVQVSFELAMPAK